MPNLDSSTVKVIGNDLRPSNFDVRELTEVLTALDNLVRSTTPLGESDEAATMCLDSIGEGSVKLRLVSATLGLITGALATVSGSVAEGDTATLPPTTRRALADLVEITRKRKLAVEFPHGSDSVVTVDQNTIVAPPVQVSGPTQIVSTVFRAGGRNPRGMFEAPDGTSLFLSLTEEQAVLCGQSLYSRVRLKGEGVWDADSHELVGFHLESIEQVPDQNQEDAIRRLGPILDLVDCDRIARRRSEGGLT